MIKKTFLHNNREMVLPSNEKALFAEKDPIATTKLLAGAPIRTTMKLQSDRVLLFSGFESPFIVEAKKEAVASVLSESPDRMEAFGDAFTNEYWSILQKKFDSWRDLGDFPITEEATNSLPNVVSADGRKRDILSILMQQNRQALIGTLVEVVVARAIGAKLLRGRGFGHDLLAKHPETSEEIYVECKSTRYSNQNWYITKRGNRVSVSRHGFYVKRGQIDIGAEVENRAFLGKISEIPLRSYVAFIDYDISGYESLPFVEITKALDEVFLRRARSREKALSLLHSLSELVEIRGIYLFPNWVALAIWNRHVLKTRPLRGKSKPIERLSDTVSYFEKRQLQEIYDIMTESGIPRNESVVHDLLGRPIPMVSYGHTFM